MKPCKKCGSTERYANGNCNQCSKANSAAYRAANPEKCKAMVNAWHKAHPEKSKANSAMWRAENPERNKYDKAEWYRQNLERRRAKMAAWRKAHPENKNSSNAKRRAMQLNATPVWANKFFIQEIYALAVLRTKMFGFKWHVDHIVPLKSKLVCGLHVEQNLRVIPAVDNMHKGNRIWPDMPY